MEWTLNQKFRKFDLTMNRMFRDPLMPDPVKHSDIVKRSGACTPTMYSVSWVFALLHTWGLSSHLGDLYSMQMGLNMSSCPYNEFGSPWRMWSRHFNGLDVWIYPTPKKSSFKLIPLPCDRFNIIFKARKPCWDVEQHLDYCIHDSTVLW